MPKHSFLAFQWDYFAPSNIFRIKKNTTFRNLDKKRVSYHWSVLFSSSLRSNGTLTLTFPVIWDKQNKNIDLTAQHYLFKQATETFEAALKARDSGPPVSVSLNHTEKARQTSESLLWHSRHMFEHRMVSLYFQVLSEHFWPVWILGSWASEDWRTHQWCQRCPGCLGQRWQACWWKSGEWWLWRRVGSSWRSY